MATIPKKGCVNFNNSTYNEKINAKEYITFINPFRLICKGMHKVYKTIRQIHKQQQFPAKDM